MEFCSFQSKTLGSNFPSGRPPLEFLFSQKPLSFPSRKRYFFRAEAAFPPSLFSSRYWKMSSTSPFSGDTRYERSDKIVDALALSLSTTATVRTRRRFFLDHRAKILFSSPFFFVPSRGKVRSVIGAPENSRGGFSFCETNFSSPTSKTLCR